MKKSLLIIAILVASLSACSVVEMDLGTGQATVANTAEPVVTMVKASSMPWGYMWATFTDKNILIRVKNLAYDKQVVVKYEMADGSWQDFPASYYGPADSGFELWKVGNSFTEEFGDEFVVRYTVNGQTYYDNNQGQNYHLGDGGKILGYAHNILEEWSGMYTENNNNIFYGNVALNDLGYHKDVAVIYTTDNWQTTQSASLDFQRMDDGVEIWHYNVMVGSATSVEYAFSYSIQGNPDTWWDNNWGSNYSQEL